MKLRLVFVGLLFSSLALAGNDDKPPKSVSVLNLSEESVDLWVNGEYRSLRAGVAVLQPCLPGEKVEVQINMELSHIECGEKKEIAQ